MIEMCGSAGILYIRGLAVRSKSPNFLLIKPLAQWYIQFIWLGKSQLDEHPLSDLEI
jgi:hypothetical protein